MNMAMTRNRFLADTVATAGPQQILVMLYDWLVLDLNRAEVAQRNGQLAQASDYLGHAQEIVGSLASTLDVDAWSGGQSLMDLYMYLVREMVGASIDGDADRTAACTAIAVPLRDSWRRGRRPPSPRARPRWPPSRRPSSRPSAPVPPSASRSWAGSSASDDLRPVRAGAGARLVDRVGRRPRRPRDERRRGGGAAAGGPPLEWRRRHRADASSVSTRHLGQLPAPLVDRARALLGRQVRVAQQLAEAAAHSRRQLRAVEGMRATGRVRSRLHRHRRLNPARTTKPRSADRGFVVRPARARTASTQVRRPKSGWTKSSQRLPDHPIGSVSTDRSPRRPRTGRPHLTSQGGTHVFESVSFVALNSALDGLALRQRVIADNVANIHTSGFLAGRVAFEDTPRRRRLGRVRRRRAVRRALARAHSVPTASRETDS